MIRALLLTLTVVVLGSGLAGLAQGKGHPAITPAPRDADWWRARFEALRSNAARGKAELVFIGDSITQGWETTGKTVWPRFYGRRRALNLGIDGDRTEHVLWRLSHGHLDGLRPKLVVLLIGTNNSYTSSADQIAAGIVAIVRTLRARLPAAKVLLLGIFPKGPRPSGQRAKLARASRLASRVADGKQVHYLDIGRRFLDEEGTLSTKVMYDYLHLTAKGYTIWARGMEPLMRRLLGEKPLPKGAKREGRVIRR
jgi:lysophospholipase L1-like esterase